MDPETNNPGASAPPPSQKEPGDTRYFPPVGQEQAPAQGYVPNGYNQGANPSQPQPQAPQPGYTYSPPPGPQPAPNGQAQGQHQYGQWQHAPWQLPAGQHDRSRALWGLILVGAGVLFLIDQLFSFSGFGSLFLLAIGGGFLYAYYNTRPGPRVGFLIPGSILLGLGVGTLLEQMDFLNIWGGYGSITTLTLGLGFCLIWFLERRQWWALIPGGILVMAGLGTMAVFGRFWPLLLIALGVYLLYEQSRRRPIH